MSILTNQLPPQFDEDLSVAPYRAQPLHVRKAAYFVVLTQWDGAGEDQHCILVERADIPALTAALEELK